jgi:ElaB/YqjD/DUF883 family membrane-anchored ribosome-binding protein
MTNKNDRVRRARAMAAGFADTAREQAEEAFEAAREKAEAVLETAYEAAEDGLDEAHSYLKRQWRQRPVAVAATVLGVGMLIGIALGSRR